MKSWLQPVSSFALTLPFLYQFVIVEKISRPQSASPSPVVRIIHSPAQLRYCAACGVCGFDVSFIQKLHLLWVIKGTTYFDDDKYPNKYAHSHSNCCSQCARKHRASEGECSPSPFPDMHADHVMYVLMSLWHQLSTQEMLSAHSLSNQWESRRRRRGEGAYLDP